MKLFINHTNHPSSLWGEAQLQEAQKYGEVTDLPFPAIDPVLDTEEVRALALETFDTIKAREPEAVLCQGESVYAFELVTMLKDAGFKVLAATSRREVREETD